MKRKRRYDISDIQLVELHNMENREEKIKRIAYEWTTITDPDIQESYIYDKLKKNPEINYHQVMQSTLDM